MAETSILILIVDKYIQKECENLLTSNKDLAPLLKGSVKCKLGKGLSTKETKTKFPFLFFISTGYNNKLPHSMKIDMEDIFGPDRVSLYPKKMMSVLNLN